MDFKDSLISDLSVNPPLGPHYIKPMVESLNLQLHPNLKLFESLTNLEALNYLSKHRMGMLKVRCQGGK